MKRLTNTAGALALLAGLAALNMPAPAEAGGGVTMMITPSGDAADLINTGLRIYGLTQQSKGSKKKKNLATVKQKGVNNAAPHTGCPNRGRSDGRRPGAGVRRR